MSDTERRAAAEGPHITLGELRRELTKSLTDAMGHEGTATARALLCDRLGLDLTELLLRDTETLSEPIAEEMRGMAKRISEGEPLQYVTGQAYFCGLSLSVGSGVLIPRPETEELAEWVAERIKVMGSKRILDIGTGSGCIALSVKSMAPETDVTGIDVSDKALERAQRNASITGLDVSFSKADILTATVQDIGTYDIVVSNPPYVRECERADMSRNVLEHEPELALFVSDDDPLIFYRRIAELCRSGALTDGGELFFEINEAFGNETVAMLADMGFAEIELRNDFTGRPRMTRCKKVCL